MRTRLVAFLLLIICGASSPALALTIQAPFGQEAIIETNWERLSPCLQDHIQHAGLKRIKVVPHGKLGQWTVPHNCPLGCETEHPVRKYDTYYAHARSFLAIDLIVLDDKWVKPEIIMHEFGHWFTNDVIRPAYWDAWKRALKLDLTDMDKCDLYDNEYLKDPDEAAAEIFAAQFVPKLTMYDVSDFKRTSAMMAEILSKTCPGRE